MIQGIAGREEGEEGARSLGLSHEWWEGRERGVRPPYRPRQGQLQAGRHVGAIVAFLARFQSFSVIYFSFASPLVCGPRARGGAARAFTLLSLSLVIPLALGKVFQGDETRPSQLRC